MQTQTFNNNKRRRTKFFVNGSAGRRLIPACKVRDQSIGQPSITVDTRLNFGSESAPKCFAEQKVLICECIRRIWLPTPLNEVVARSCLVRPSMNRPQRKRA